MVSPPLDASRWALEMPPLAPWICFPSSLVTIGTTVMASPQVLVAGLAEDGGDEPQRDGPIRGSSVLVFWESRSLVSDQMLMQRRTIGWLLSGR